MNRITVLFSLLLVGCIETGLQPEDVEGVVPYPPEAGNPVQEDRILQIQQPQVDVLFVVDNSCSMSEEQALLGNNFPRFMDYFVDSGLDFHIGVISTDVQDQSQAGLLRVVNGVRFIDEDTANPANVFSYMANMGTGGFYDEKGRAAAYTMVELNSDRPRNLDFIRQDAALHMVFISDEEDQSGGVPVSMSEFRNWMRNLKQTPDMVTAHAIVGIPGQSCAASDTPGTQYLNYANFTGGVVFNLCETNWAPLLDELGLQTSGLKREYFLSKIPVTSPWSLEVKVVTKTEAGQPVTIQFPSCLAGTEEESATCRVTYNPGRNSIVFLDYVPDPFAEIKVKYNIRELFQAL